VRDNTGRASGEGSDGHSFVFAMAAHLSAPDVIDINSLPTCVRLLRKRKQPACPERCERDAHTDVTGNDPEQIEVPRYLQARFGHGTCHHFCLGSGTPNLEDYLKRSGTGAALPEVAACSSLSWERFTGRNSEE
jgi:hypothetical protein